MADSQKQIRLGAAQIAEVYHNREATIEKDCRFIRKAGERDIDLLVFPEFHVASSPYWYWYDGNFKRFQQYYRAMFDNAVTVPGPATDKLCEAARDAGVAVVIGVNEKKADTAGTMYNSQIFINRTVRYLVSVASSSRPATNEFSTLVGRAKMSPRSTHHLVRLAD